MPNVQTTTLVTNIPGPVQSPYKSPDTQGLDNDLQGFYGVTPVVQPAATAQSAVATTAITTLATTPTATDIAIAVNSLIERVSALVTLANAERSALVDLGLIKGAAA
jgi:hypothetical protein